MFKSTAALPKEAFVLIFDLEGFSKFFSQPEVHKYVPKYLNIVFQAMELVINDEDNYWEEQITTTSSNDNANERKRTPLSKPIHFKYMGDGALYIWDLEDEGNKSNMLAFINRLWNLKIDFQKVVDKALEEIPVADVPTKIRVGLASGSVYKLEKQQINEDEYIGYAINLASRLQSYCRELGFIYSSRVEIEKEMLLEFKYLRVIANQIKGFPREIVVVDEQEFISLDPKIKKDLFTELNKK